MPNQSYPAFGKVKTIVLPVGEAMDGMTFEDYKRLYGIDLVELFNPRFDTIDEFVKIDLPKNTLLLLQDESGHSTDLGHVQGALFPVTIIDKEIDAPQYKTWISSASGASYVGLIFEYDSDNAAFTLRYMATTY